MFCLGVKIVLNGAGGGVGKGKQYSTTGVKVVESIISLR